MIVGILGLGLIGGSLARAYALAGHTVYAIQRDEAMLSFAMLSGAVHGKLTEQTVPECDLLLLAIYPDGCATWLENHAHLISKDALVIDCCGVKREICERCFPIAEKYGFTFVGGHPMAGTQYSGFSHSKPTLFKGASMIMCPGNTPLDVTENTKQFFISLGFGSVVFCTPEFHDSQIAFTSQLAHVVSNAYIKSPAAQEHKGFSAGSYKDLTRVARLNPSMWAELFLENRENICREIDTIVDELKKYSDAIKANDKDELEKLLADGVAKKLSAENRK